MRCSVLILLSGLISACGWSEHPVDNKFTTYIKRISNVQQATMLPFPDAVSITLPEPRELALPVADVSFGLFDSYELRECELFTLIAEKNSILGKVQDKFRNFDYQTQLILGINRCLLSDDISHQLKQELRHLAQLKREQLPAHFNNLVFTSHAMRAQLSGYHWVDQEISSITATQKQALYAVNVSYIFSREAHPGHKSVSLTPYQEIIEKSPLIGRLNYSMLNATLKLNTITEQLNQFDEKIICGVGRDSTRFKTLRNVFQLYYVETIQPYLAQIDRMYYQVSPYLAFTHSAHPSYSYPTNKIHEEFRSSIARHVKYWQQLMQRCGDPPQRT